MDLNPNLIHPAICEPTIQLRESCSDSCSRRDVLQTIDTIKRDCEEKSMVLVMGRRHSVPVPHRYIRDFSDDIFNGNSCGRHLEISGIDQSGDSACYCFKIEESSSVNTSLLNT